MAIRVGQRNTVKAGPFAGVMNTPDAYDGAPDKLLAARNLYSPAPNESSAIASRPGFDLLNNGAAVYTNATRFKGQGVGTHYDLDGTPTNFVAMGGKLFRRDPTTDLLTDVTPVGVALDASVSTRVYFADMGGVMCVSDGVHRPWIASTISATPIVGTYIDIDGAGTTWAAFGPPVVFGGSGFFVLSQVNSVGARIDIAWSETNDWTTGYQQTDFDNRWTLEQTGTSPITGLAPTNVALNYFRQRSIGAISGAVGPDLATTATHDAISTNVGTEAPQTIVLFGDRIFFCDVIGRPWMFTLGSAPVPIWHQMRALVDAASTGFPSITTQVASATLDPTLNQYCVAIWSPQPSTSASPAEWSVFDANTGNYVGQWSVGPADPGIDVDCLGSFTDADGRGSLVALGSATAGGTSGYAWSMSDLVGTPDILTTEGGVLLTTNDSILLTTDGQDGTFKDNGDVPLIYATTDRLGYSEDYTWLWDQATIVTGSQAPIIVTVATPLTTGVVQGTPTPAASADGVYRTQLGLDIQGREAIVTIQPTTADSQWTLNRVSLVGIPSVAQADDS